MRTGAAGILVGVGPGGGLHHPRGAGIGVPMATALADAAGARIRHLEETGRYVQVIADGGMRTGGDVAKAIACGADAVMVGRPAGRSRPPAGATGAWPPSTRTCPGGPGWGPPARHPQGDPARPGAGQRRQHEPVRGLRTSMATTGYQTVKEFQKAEVMSPRRCRPRARSCSAPRAWGWARQGVGSSSLLRRRVITWRSQPRWTEQNCRGCSATAGSRSRRRRRSGPARTSARPGRRRAPGGGSAAAMGSSGSATVASSNKTHHTPGIGVWCEVWAPRGGDAPLGTHGTPRQAVRANRRRSPYPAAMTTPAPGTTPSWCSTSAPSTPSSSPAASASARLLRGRPLRSTRPRSAPTTPRPWSSPAAQVGLRAGRPRPRPAPARARHPGPRLCYGQQAMARSWAAGSRPPGSGSTAAPACAPSPRAACCSATCPRSRSCG